MLSQRKDLGLCGIKRIFFFFARKQIRYDHATIVESKVRRTRRFIGAERCETKVLYGFCMRSVYVTRSVYVCVYVYRLDCNYLINDFLSLF